MIYFRSFINQVITKDKAVKKIYGFCKGKYKKQGNKRKN